MALPAPKPPIPHQNLNYLYSSLTRTNVFSTLILSTPDPAIFYAFHCTLPQSFIPTASLMLFPSSFSFPILPM